MSGSADTNPFGTDPFLTERQYRIERFAQVLPALLGRHVALYGTGANTRDVLERYGAQLDLVGLVDEERAGEELDGVAVMRFDEAVERGAQVVVIAAKAPSELAIARRLFGACARCGVALVDLYGNDVLQLASHDGTLECDQLAELVADCDVVSADVTPTDMDDLELWARQQAGVEVPERSIARVVRAAKAQGKLVVGIAEGSGAVIRPVQGELDDVLRTRELGCTKENGLFRVLRSRWPGARIAHVGLEVDRDALMPRLVGVEGYCVSGQRIVDPQVEFATGPRDVSAPSNPAESALLAALGQRPAGQDDAAWLFGYRALGPALVGYTTWLFGAAVKQGLDGLLFPSRDGWLMRQVYEALRQARGEARLPRSCYLMTSRAAALDASPVLFELEATASAADDGKAPSKAASARANLLAYIEREGLGVGGRYGFCDFVGLGTCQFLLQQVVDFELVGCYVGRRSILFDAPGPVCSYLSGIPTGVTKGYLALEQIMSSPQPSVVGYDDDGEPVLGEEDRSERDIARMLVAHQGVLAFAHGFAAESGWDDGEVRAPFAAALFDREAARFAGWIDDDGLPGGAGFCDALEKGEAHGC